jgi:hypothetical protein
VELGQVFSPEDWIFSCFERTKVQISRVGKKRQILAKPVVHREHREDVLEESFDEAFVEVGSVIVQVDGRRLIDSMGSAFGTYDAVLDCDYMQLFAQ